MLTMMLEWFSKPPSKILSDQQIKRLKEHKYSSNCASLFDPYMQIFWNWFVTLVPLWIAPNLITIVGLAINIITTAVVLWYCPTATEVAPWWTTAMAGLGLFVYQTLDAIDGKQARRTNSSNPLGELFDHGCDSLSTVFVSLASCCAVQLGRYPAWMLFQCICASTLFYCAHWQTYVSGTLQFGTIDVTEGQLVVVAVMSLASLGSFLNVDIWATSKTDLHVLIAVVVCEFEPGDNAVWNGVRPGVLDVPRRHLRQDPHRRGRQERLHRRWYKCTVPRYTSTLCHYSCLGHRL